MVWSTRPVPCVWSRRTGDSIIQIPIASESILALVSLLLVVGGAELLTTGLEWVGVRLGLSEGSTGSVFAALATSLPETMIPVLAIIEGSGPSIGTGAILGGPITLTTLAAFLLGASALAYAARGVREPSFTIDTPQVKRDLRVFLAGFSVAFLATFVRSDTASVAISLLLVALYFSYLYRVSRQTGDDGVDDPEPLELGRPIDTFRRLVSRVDRSRDFAANPPNSLVALQVILAVGLLLLGSHLLIGAIEWAARTVVPVPTIIVALLVAPIVSNLPENVDGVIWISREADSLAVEQLTGTLAFHGTVAVSIGVSFTPWRLTPAWGTIDFLVAFSAVVSLLSGGVLYLRVATTRGRRIAPHVFVSVGLFYASFVALVGHYLAAGFL